MPPLKPITIMEVCGTHTMAIARHGLKKLFPPGVRMVSGPGCPVCVTPVEDIDRAIEIAKVPGVILTTFGDMLRVPGSRSTLELEKAAGADIRIVYSPVDALDIAVSHPDKKIVFVGVGFETTAPIVAATVAIAHRKRIRNFSVLPLFKTVPPALKALLAQDTSIDAFLLPGHVSAIIGARPYAFIARDFKIPGVIAGFDPDGILRSVERLTSMIRAGTPGIVIDYSAVVRPEGNTAAQKTIATVLTPVDARWRAIGIIPGSGLGLSTSYASFDAAKMFPVVLPPPREPRACQCGAMMLGKKTPQQCPLFAKRCTPASPVGPCMVSSEGTCAAAFRYESSSASPARSAGGRKKSTYHQGS